MDITRWVRLIHIYTAAPVLLSMLMFSVTGFLLNHPNWELGENKELQDSFEIPESLHNADWKKDTNLVALQLLVWLEKDHDIRGVEIETEWEEEESLLVINLDGPGHSYSIEAYKDDNVVDIFGRKAPLLKTLSNIHSRDHVSSGWQFVSDISAILMLLFTLSGLWLVLINVAHRYTAALWATSGGIITFLIIYMMH